MDGLPLRRREEDGRARELCWSCSSSACSTPSMQLMRTFGENVTRIGLKDETTNGESAKQLTANVTRVAEALVWCLGTMIRGCTHNSSAAAFPVLCEL